MTGDETATMRQRQWIRDLGATTVPEDLDRAEASKWIDELKAYDGSARRGTIPEARIRTDLFERPPGRGPTPPAPTVTHEVGGPVPGATAQVASTVDGNTSSTSDPNAHFAGMGASAATPVFQTAEQMRAQGPAQAAIVPYDDRDEDRGPLTPVQVMTQKERDEYGLAETTTVVVRGTKENIVPEYGMPAKYLFARLSVNRRTNRPDIRVFPSIEGLTFRANAYADGIRKLSFEYIAPEAIPGLAEFVKETKDPQIIARAHLVLGNGTEVIEEGTVRVSEIQLHPSRRDPHRMVASSPVARTNYLEIAKKRALARALRWGTGFGGTALDELPPAETAIAPAGPPKKDG